MAQHTSWTWATGKGLLLNSPEDMATCNIKSEVKYSQAIYQEGGAKRFC
ncbi:hypothetical protein SULPSESMR1_02806 [Pseudosulfitobacter pseudonitzschiae]|uniref:Uncharacterized protein n=1 Tax=Pseudosulfitobacter pseudonitzschiae TaxID=1402135 RepID=A0A221K3M4_9RHOB|nr:hypothetical protein SULPSESMR1_02806 [Pseudosulfitobacter pseudonitzschiae]